MDDVQFGAVAMTLRSPKQPDGDLRLVLRLVRADIRDSWTCPPTSPKAEEGIEPLCTPMLLE
jgi:hypothetical protein